MYENKKWYEINATSVCEEELRIKANVSEIIYNNTVTFTCESGTANTVWTFRNGTVINPVPRNKLTEESRETENGIKYISKLSVLKFDYEDENTYGYVNLCNVNNDENIQ